MLKRLLSAFAAPAPKAPPKGELATLSSGRDITRGLIDSLPTLPGLDPLLGRGAGPHPLDTYTQVLDDWQVFAALQQRRNAVVATEWEVIPGGTRRQDKAAAKLLEAVLDALDWDQITAAMHHGIFFGAAYAEVMWMRDGGQVVPERIKVRDPRRFAFRPSGELVLLTTAAAVHGELLPERKFWHFCCGGVHDDDPYGMGVAHWCYWPVQFKRGDIKLWMVALDKYASPTALGHFPPNATPAERNKLLAALEAIRSQAALILPEGMSAELLSASRSAAGDYAEAARYFDAAISKVISGHGAVSDATAGRLGGEDMAGEVRQDLIQADADLLCASANSQWVRWTSEWNYPNAAPPKIWRRTEENESLDSRAEREQRIYAMGFRPTLAHIQNVYDGEWEDTARSVGLGADTPPAPETDTPPAPEPDPTTDLAAQPETAPDYADIHAARLEQAASPAIQTWVEGIRAALDASLAAGEDIAAFRARLLGLYPELPDAELTAVLGEAMAAADLAGRYDIEQGD